MRCFRALAVFLAVLMALPVLPASAGDRTFRAILGIGARVLQNELDRRRPRHRHRAPSRRQEAPVLRNADSLSRSEIVSYQRALNALGFAAGEPDGHLGPMTGRAIADFVRSRGLDPATTPRRQAYAMAVAAVLDTVTEARASEPEQPGPAAAGEPIDFGETALAGQERPAEAGDLAREDTAGQDSSRQDPARQDLVPEDLAGEDDEPLTRAEIAAYQQALNTLGFAAGKPDGRLGPATADAIAAFVESEGRDPEGVGQREAFVLAVAAAGRVPVEPADDPPAVAADDAAPEDEPRDTAGDQADAPAQDEPVDVAMRPRDLLATGKWRLASSKTCSDRRDIIDRLGRDMRMSLGTDAIAAGDKASIAWARGRFPEREPVFLMVSFSEPVRLGGEAFYGLLPNARAAFDIAWNRDRTRAVVPLFGRKVPTSGTLAVAPLFAGDVAVDWTVVGYDGCNIREAPEGRGRAILRVSAAGKPQIVVNDPTDLGTPNGVLASPDGTRRIVVYKDRFRLLDTATGAELLERAGTDPRFSPTGRFVTVKTQDRRDHLDDQTSIIDGLLVVDALDGRRILFTQYWNGGWYNADSLLAVNWGGWGLTSIFDPTSGRSLLADVEMATCRICGFDPFKGFAVSLEDNYLVLTDTETSGSRRKGELVVAGLTTEERVPATDARSAARLASSATGVTRALADGRVAPAAPLVEAAASLEADSREAEEPSKEASLAAPAPDLAAGDPTKTQVLNWRRQVGATSKGHQGGSLLARISDFGIATAERLPATTFEAADMDAEKVSQPTFADEATTEERRAGFDAYDRRVAEIRRRFTNRIANETGLPRDGFRKLSGCSLFEDPTTGEIDYSEDANYTPLFMTRAWRWASGSGVAWLTTNGCAEGSAGFLYPLTQLHVSVAGGRRIELSQRLKDESTDIGTVCPMSLDACRFDIAVFGDDLVIWSSEANGVGVYDIATDTMRMKRFGIPQGDIIDGAHLLKDRRHVLVTFANGQFLILRVADGGIALNGRYADDEVVVWVPDGRFDATSEGASFVSFRFPGRIGEYSFQQFDARLRVPGLVDKVLSGGLDERPIALSPPPDLAATIEPAAEGAVTVTASARGTEPVARMQVFQDGLLTDTIPIETEAGTAEWSGDIERLPGTRWLSLVATDAASVVSLPIGRDIGAGARRRIHVLSIGIERFDDPRIPALDGPAEDAATFASTLKQLASAGGATVQIASETLLTDREASPERILSELEKLVADVPKGETIALFFAGHGLQAKDGRYYLVPSTAKVADLGSTAIAWSKLAAVVARAKTRVAVFIDACQSGFAGSDLFAANDAAVGSILDAAPSGVVVFAASKGRQAAVESDQAKGGYFTRAIEAALTTERAATDRNGNGAIEISELYGAIKRAVVERTDGRQTPWIARNQMIGDFALF
ncbi:hypothetical protein E3C22_10570 [Jiella endophytica]|uniref:Caspase family p20 domain-containing protein n=1 Tax=Jiella endophytica TaxID=2558362 RepID=A0A4Y8RJH5_9HYPH|nr:peptidoglycan-binding protein [Jiella endophytica]TFF22892.1 hypothetical protein E3C22_10570 [Jiella endophytica]